MNEYAYGWQIPQRVEKFRLNITYGVRTIYISSQSMIACYLKLLELGSVNKQKDPFYHSYDFTLKFACGHCMYLFSEENSFG